MARSELAREVPVDGPRVVLVTGALGKETPEVLFRTRPTTGPARLLAVLVALSLLAEVAEAGGNRRHRAADNPEHSLDSSTTKGRR